MSVCKQTPKENVQLVNRSSENKAFIFLTYMHFYLYFLLCYFSWRPCEIAGASLMGVPSIAK